MQKFETNAEKKAFNEGVKYANHYIAFCMSKYIFKLNLRGIIAFIKDLQNFIKNPTYIPNTERVTFKEFCNNYSILD